MFPLTLQWIELRPSERIAWIMFLLFIKYFGLKCCLPPLPIPRKKGVKKEKKETNHVKNNNKKPIKKINKLILKWRHAKRMVTWPSCVTDRANSTPPLQFTHKTCAVQDTLAEQHPWWLLPRKSRTRKTWNFFEISQLYPTTKNVSIVDRGDLHMWIPL